MYSKKNIPFKSWIEISKSNLFNNLKEFRKVNPGKIIACVIKANAYGHSLVEISQLLKNEKNIWLIVDNYKEALKIREMRNNQPILVLGYTPLYYLKDAGENNLSLVISNSETLKEIVRQKIKIKIHLKLETGMNRRGLSEKEFIRAIEFVKKYPNHFIFEGVLTHFADAENVKDPSFSLNQLKKFNKILLYLEKKDIKIPFIHFAKTSSSLLYPRNKSNLVRIGIGLYGLWPSSEIKNKFPKIKLERVLSWKSIVAEINNIKKGESVGYGRTWSAQRDSEIAVIPIGYYDGFDRKLSNLGRVLIKGRSCPVVGRVAMNMITVDVTGIKGLKLEDEVVIIGKQGKNEITAEEIAEKIGTINYEIVTRINPLIPRIIV